jgi:hypothetical protein
VLVLQKLLPLLGKITGLDHPIEVARMTVLPSPVAAASEGPAVIDGRGGSSAEFARHAIGANEQLKAVTGVDLAQIARSVSARLEAPDLPPQPGVSMQPLAPVRGVPRGDQAG